MAAPKTESLAMSKPAEEAPKPVANSEAASGTPATAAAANSIPAPAPATEARPNPAMASGAAPAPAPASSPAPTPAPAAANANAASNPFAVASENQTPAPAPASGSVPAAAGATPPAAGPAAEAEPAAEAPVGNLNAAAANRGDPKMYRSPQGGAMVFLAAVKAKDLPKIAEATALHAPYEASGKNQKLFAAILDQDLAQEDLDELAKKLDGYQFAGANVAKSSGQLGIIVTKPEGTSIMRRTITMRHEKAGWKVQDISGQGEIEKPIVMPRMGGRMGGGRR
jgi:hypothetical protein